MKVDAPFGRIRVVSGEGIEWGFDVKIRHFLPFVTK
jgi:hypothetical protein